ncbi:MAG: cation transporter, partial [Devosia sp.]
MSLAGAAAPQYVQTGNADLGEFARAGTTGRSILVLAVPDAYCATCIDSIEHSLRNVPGVVTARVNLSRRHVRVEYATASDPVALVSAVMKAGYRTYPVDQDHVDGDPAFRDLLRATAVAGFAAGNIMLFSVSIWAGADEPTRNLFHWISA